MKKKLIIGMLVFGASLFSLSSLYGVQREGRVLASEAGGTAAGVQATETINITVEPIGYNSVKATLDKNNTIDLSSRNNSDRNHYKYSWVENVGALPEDSSDLWKALPTSAGEGDSDPKDIIVFSDAVTGKYLVIKKVAGGNEGVIFQTKAVFERETYNETPRLTKLLDGRFLITFSDYVTGFQYRKKVPGEAEREVDNGEWINAKSTAEYINDGFGTDVTYYVRVAAKGNKLASEVKELRVVKRSQAEEINLETLEGLTYTLEDDGLKISGLENLRTKTSELTYEEVGISSAVLSSGSISYGNKSSVILPAQNRVEIKSDGLTVLTFTFVTKTFEDGEEGNIKQKDKTKEIIGLDNGASYEYKKEGADAYTGIAEHSKSFSVDDFGTYFIRKQGSKKEIRVSGANMTIYFPSKDVKVTLQKENPAAPSLPPSVYYPDYSVNPPVKSEETKKEEKPEEAKKEEKKEEKVVEEPKVEEPKVEESKTEESKTEETVKPVTETVKAPKKTSVAVASKKIASILKADAGKLSISMKNATVTLPKGILKTVFAEEAGSLKVSVKTVLPKEGGKDEKAIEKRLKKNRLLSKDIYHLSVKVGKESLNQYDLFGEKFTVTLQTKLKNAPKKLYVMNLSNGKLIKVKFKAGEVKFKTELAGKFVLVTK